MDYVVIALLLVILGYLFLGRSKPDIDGPAARALVEDEGAMLLDVRTSAEYAGGHLPGAINIPVQELSDRLDELRKDGEGKPIVVYCQSGMRSARAKKDLERGGLSKVHDLGSRHRW